MTRWLDSLRDLLLSAILLAPLSAAAAEPVVGGKPWYLVNFWSEWCAPCREEIPMLNALSEALTSAGVRVVGVNFDDDPPQDSLKIAASLGIEFPTLSREEAAQLGVAAPDVMPTTYLVSPQGEVAAKLIGLQTRAQLEATLLRLGLLPVSS